MAYSTGNPIGSTDPRDLSDNSDDIDVWANSETAETHPNRLGVPRKTMRGMEVEFEGKLVDFTNQVNDIVIAGGQIFETETDGRAAVQNGQYFYAESGDPAVALVIYERIDAATSRLVAEQPSALYVSGLDSYRVNASKPYPLLRKIRAGIDYPARQGMLDAILDARVYAARDNVYYRIAAIQNGFPDWGGTLQGIRIERASIATYESTGAAVILHDYTSDVGLDLDYTAGGIQRTLFKTDLGDAYVELVIDVGKLQETYGSPLIALNDSQLGYNWIIDPVAYTPAQPQSIISERLESGPLSAGALSAFPSEVVNRGGSTLSTHPYMDQSLLDAVVFNAREGYSYRIGFIANGAVVNGEISNGVTITRIPDDRIAEGFEEQILQYTDTSVTLIPNRSLGGAQVFDLPCPLDPQTTIRLVFDVDRMPPDGSAFSALNTNTNGYNARIIPSRYVLREEVNTLKNNLYVQFLASENSKLMVSYLAGSKWYRAHAARKSINNTFQLLGYSYAAAYTSLGALIPPHLADWTVRAEADSDYHAPVVIQAASNGDNVAEGSGATPGSTVTAFKNGIEIGSATAFFDGDYVVYVGSNALIGEAVQVTVDGSTVDVVVSEPGVIYTSGAHSTSGTSDGNGPTAVQSGLIIFAGGERLNLANDAAFYAPRDSVYAIGRNLVMGYNTAFSGRHILEQNYRYDFFGGGVEISVNYKALEALTITADNGCQVYLAGMTPITNNTYLFWGGDQPAREDMPSGVFTSGPKSAFPNCGGVSVRHPVAGELSSWMDLTYGVGDRRHLPDSEPLYDHSNVNGAKIYPRLFNASNPVPIAAGEGYVWRGGYYWGMPTDAPALDAAVETTQGTVLLSNDGRYVYV